MIKASNMKKVLHIKNEIIVDGVMSCEMAYAKELYPEYIFDWMVYEIKSEEIKRQIEELGGTIHQIPSFSSGSATIKTALFFRKLVKENQYGIIHIDTELHRWRLLLKAALFGVKKRIIHSHNSSSEKYINAHDKTLRQKQRMVTLFATDCLACSEHAGEYMFGTEVGKNKKYHLIRNCIDPIKYSFNVQNRDQYRLLMNAQDKKIVLFAGRLSLQKNPLFALEIFRALQEKNKSAELWIAGDGQLKEEIENKVKEYGLSENVKMLGVVNDIPTIMQAADALLMPSLYEGFSLVPIEAQATGLPALCSDRITQDANITGIIRFESLDESPEIWAEKLEAIINMPIRREEYHQLVKKAGYDIKDNAETLKEIYKG